MEILREKIIDLPSTSNTVSRPTTNLPLRSIENVMEMLPSTPKDLPSTSNTVSRPTTNLPLRSIENVMEMLPSTPKGVKKTRKVNVKTLAEIKLNQKLIAVRNKLSKCKNKMKKQAAAIKVAKNVIDNPNTQKALENLSQRGRILTMMQFRENKKKCKGRRFTYQEKILALSLLKQSPKGYRFLRNLLILPAPQTLIKLLTQANLQPGINENVFSQMKNQADKMKSYEKLCVLIYDEMALRPNLSYNERLDKVIGFVNNGEETSDEFADHAQVFMIRGLLKNYKQPIGYTFSSAATKGIELKSQIKKYVREIRKTGFTVVATICDQGSGNRSAKTKEKVFKKCTTCNMDFIDINENEYVKYREFQNKRWLCSPSKELIITISKMQDLIYLIMKNNLK